MSIQTGALLTITGMRRPAKLTAESVVRYIEPMLTQKWKTSERQYRVREERDFAIPVSDGTKLNSYLYRMPRVSFP